jgi:hypothetical protein
MKPTKLLLTAAVLCLGMIPTFIVMSTAFGIAVIKEAIAMEEAIVI